MTDIKKFPIAFATSLLIFCGQVDVEIAIDKTTVAGVETQEASSWNPPRRR